MRLICPNCDAQYEVDGSAIPLNGRDVQCSNCGHGWFQAPDQAEELPAPAPVTITPPEATAPTAPQPAPEPEPEPAPNQPRRVPVVESSATEDEEDMVAPAPLPPVMPMRRSLDESVLAVLREEAEREAAARRAEAQTIEVQGELGLPPPVSPMVGHIRPPEPEDDLDRAFERELEAEMRAEANAVRATPTSKAEGKIAAKTVVESAENLPPNHAQAALARRGSIPNRRDMFPDIEEINSTLLPSEPQYKAAAVETPAEARGSFRAGFLLMLALALLVAGVYIAAPMLAERLPQLAPALDAYVQLVDQARAFLDQLIRRATGVLDGLTGRTG